MQKAIDNGKPEVYIEYKKAKVMPDGCPLAPAHWHIQMAPVARRWPGPLTPAAGACCWRLR